MLPPGNPFAPAYLSFSSFWTSRSSEKSLTSFAGFMSFLNPSFLYYTSRVNVEQRMPRKNQHESGREAVRRKRRRALFRPANEQFRGQLTDG